MTPSRYSAQIQKAVEICGLTNIRIIQKIIRVANRILEHELSDAVLTRVVPSIVLLTAINYKGIEDGPSFEFVLAIGSESDFSGLVADTEKEPDDEDKRTARWRLLLDELNIGRCDEFETLVVEFLESGQFDASKVAVIVNRYAAETDRMKAFEKAHQFLKRLRWDHRLQEVDLIAEATELVPLAHLLDPYLVTELDRDLNTLVGGGVISQAIVQGWLTAFRARNDDLSAIEDNSAYVRPLHPDISSEFEKNNARTQAKTTIFDACMHIVKQSGWGTRQEIAMKTATAEDFEATIRNLPIDDFRPFMRRMIEMRIQRQMYVAHFGSATERFVEACRMIANDPKAGRLGTIIKRMFDGAKLSTELAAQFTPSSNGNPLNTETSPPQRS